MPPNSCSADQDVFPNGAAADSQPDDNSKPNEAATDIDPNNHIALPDLGEEGLLRPAANKDVSPSGAPADSKPNETAADIKPIVQEGEILGPAAINGAKHNETAADSKSKEAEVGNKPHAGRDLDLEEGESLRSATNEGTPDPWFKFPAAIDDASPNGAAADRKPNKTAADCKSNETEVDTNPNGGPDLEEGEILSPAANGTTKPNGGPDLEEGEILSPAANEPAIETDGLLWANGLFTDLGLATFLEDLKTTGCFQGPLTDGQFGQVLGQLRSTHGFSHLYTQYLDTRCVSTPKRLVEMLRQLWLDESAHGSPCHYPECIACHDMEFEVDDSGGE
ncbi:hypothetical protein PGT21_021575 [Puccinia graminis f. sp. tritici]|uniref:Uncharacterized protein n=1 Tax=Puccinia graminis f. sp. tritici TaxID=56615 RepID=A0A5B0LZQ4_PUCGR|nr:hypothetical protein PGT21_021575 [Puccinia graminis f. sp. tritici]